jgi:hypothetical protein
MAMTEQQRVDAGNELDAASKAYDAYLKKTSTAPEAAAESKGPAAVPPTPAPEAAAESKGPAAVPPTPASGDERVRNASLDAVPLTPSDATDPITVIVDQAIAEATKAVADDVANRSRLDELRREEEARVRGGKRKKKGTRRHMRGGDRLLDALKALGKDSPSPRPAFMKLITVSDEQVALRLVPIFNTFIKWERSINGRRLMLPDFEQKKFADALFRDVPTAWPTINPVFKKLAPISNYVRAAEALAAVAANRPRELTAEEAAVVDSETAKQTDVRFNASLSNTFLPPELSGEEAAPAPLPAAAAVQAPAAPAAAPAPALAPAAAAPALAPAAPAPAADSAAVQAPAPAAAAVQAPAPAAAAVQAPALDAAGVVLPAPAATTLTEPEVADAARESCADIAKEKLGTNPTFVAIPGDGWCYYNAILTGGGIGDLGALAFIEQLKPLMPEGWTGAKPILNHETGSNDTLTYVDYVAKLGETYNGTTNLKYWPEGEYVSPAVVAWFKKQSPPRNVTLAIYEQTAGPINLITSYALAGGNTFYVGDDCAGNEVLSLAHNSTNHFDLFVNTEAVAAAPLSAEPEDASSRRESVFSEPAASVASRPSSAASLATVGVPQLRDQDFTVRLGAAKVKFEQMRAATRKLETRVDASTVVRKPKKQTRITEADIDNLYRELKASQSKRQAKTVSERNERAQRGRTAKVAPAPVDDELAAIEADLKSAEETVEQFKALVDELRANDSGVPEVAEWIMTADMELELQLDYLSQVEQNLADVPPPNDLTRLREVHASLGLPRPPASLAKPPWRNGGRRKTPRRRRKLRNSTFRRHRKH